MSMMIVLMRFCMMFITMVFFFFLWCILLFPSRNNNFFLLGPEVDRLSMHECFIQFLDVFSGNIVFSMSRKVSLYNSRKRIHQNIERFTIILYVRMMPLCFFRMFLNKSNNCIRISRTIECELISS